ncbi:telomerase RNA component interacting RNase-like isoform X2 [Scleropages formosus]|uniref:Telomerase RNA component interacting RNase n=1 Tax=Scleropages formosus TaxID=113540 RepID=A0A8C9TTP8_SCLFO|nr:telomerase RNA component interacting RNase isoform X2 [Scleropages formosus]
MESKRGSKDIVVENDSDSSSDSRPNSPETSGGNAFANDGSFLELFKRKMEEEERRRRKEQQQQQEEKNKMKEGRGDTRCPQGPQSSGQKKTFSVTSFVGRRRGGAKLALKTGVVAKKRKLDSEGDSNKGDAWAKYMAEVMKYKAHQCGDDDKTRPLVK